MKEKRGVVEQGRTPPETDEKQASEDALEDHLTKRAADAVGEAIQQKAGRAVGDISRLKDVDFG